MFQRGIHIMTFRGIELRLDYSWFIIFLLIAWSFITVLIPQQLPNLSLASRFGMGIIATLLFFTSVIIHEFSHSLYAKSHGLPIKRITLFVFGGASELEAEPTSPGQEFMMAILGPVASIVLGLIFWWIWLIGRNVDNTWLVAIGGPLATINILLAVFNLLPGFPLDGGRVFRSIVWRITGSLQRATRIATTGGQVVGAMLIAVGCIELFAGGVVSGLWLGLIGFFLMQAARMSYLQTKLLAATKDRRVRDFMISGFEPITFKPSEAAFFEQLLPQQHTGSDVALAPGDSLTKALDIARKTGLQQIPVTEQGNLVGFFMLERLLKYLNQPADKSSSAIRDR